MQENNFEKQAQEKLGELRVNPSGEVWLKVQASLKKKKDRRVLVLLLSVLFLAGAGFLSYNFYDADNARKQPQPIAASTPANSQKPTLDLVKAAANNSTTKKGTSLNTDYPKKSVQNKKQASLLVQIPANKSAKSSIGVENDNLIAAAVKKAKTLFYKATKIRRYIGTKTATQADGVVIETKDDAETDVPLSMRRTTFNLSGISSSSNKPKVYQTNEFINGKNLTLPEIASKKQGAASNSVAKSGKKLRISLDAGFARAGTANSYLGNIPNNTFYDYSLPQSSSVGSAGVPDSLRAYNINPSAVNPGVGFFASILFTKQLSGRSSISAGLRYQLFNTTQSVGAAVTRSAINSQRQEGVFKAGIGNSYTNNYHLLAIPVEFNVQLSRFKQHNIFATTGISVSKLVHTNALQFDNISRQYFKNNDLFNKTIVGFSAGMFVNLKKNTKPPLLLGPLFQYSFTPLANEGLYANSHYSFLGLRLQKSLKRQ